MSKPGEEGKEEAPHHPPPPKKKKRKKHPHTQNCSEHNKRKIANQRIKLWNSP